MKIFSNAIVGIVSVCIWSYAAYFALKWFGHMIKDTITYSGMALPVLSVLVILGTIGSIALFIMTQLGKVKPLWQNVMLALGIIAVWMINGG